MRKRLLIVLVISLVIAAYAWHRDAQAPYRTTVACTEEALMCPDGSLVERTGPECAFVACSNADSYTGKLVQQGEDFFLVIAAPKESLKEVTYALPLHNKTKTSLESFLGKQVVVSGVFSAGNMLEVQSIKLSTTQNTFVSLGLGETGTASGVRITLNKGVNDSRCPIGVKCISAGFTAFEVTLQSDTDQETLVMRTDKPAHAFDSFKVSIVGVEPLPRPGDSVKDLQYRVTFNVESL